jgi:hypothetical protein
VTGASLAGGTDRRIRFWNILSPQDSHCLVRACLQNSREHVLVNIHWQATCENALASTACMLPPWVTSRMHSVLLMQACGLPVTLWLACEYGREGRIRMRARHGFTAAREYEVTNGPEQQFSCSTFGFPNQNLRPCLVHIARESA